MKYVLFFALVIPFVFVSGFGFLSALSGDGHHHTPGCPYMPGEYAICPMSSVEHLIAWQKTFTRIVVPPLIFFVSCMACFWLFFVINVRVMRTQTRCVLRVAIQRIRCIENEIQTLFSSGILNPKAP